MTKFLLDFIFQMGVVFYLVCSVVVVFVVIGMLACVLNYLWEKKLLGRLLAVLLAWVLLALFATVLGGIPI